MVIKETLGQHFSISTEQIGHLGIWLKCGFIILVLLHRFLQLFTSWSPLTVNFHEGRYRLGTPRPASTAPRRSVLPPALLSPQHLSLPEMYTWMEVLTALPVPLHPSQHRLALATAECENLARPWCIWAGLTSPTFSLLYVPGQGWPGEKSLGRQEGRHEAEWNGLWWAGPCGSSCLLPLMGPHLIVLGQQWDQRLLQLQWVVDQVHDQQCVRVTIQPSILWTQRWCETEAGSSPSWGLQFLPAPPAPCAALLTPGTAGQPPNVKASAFRRLAHLLHHCIMPSPIINLFPNRSQGSIKEAQLLINTALD